MKSPKDKLAHGGSECGPRAGSGNKSNVKYVTRRKLSKDIKGPSFETSPPKVTLQSFIMRRVKI